MIVQDALNVPALTVYYDAACPICNGEMHNLMLRDVARQVRFVDASAPGFERPDGVGQADLMNLKTAVTQLPRSEFVAPKAAAVV